MTIVSHATAKRILLQLVATLLFVAYLFAGPVFSQSAASRIAFGFDAEGNKYWGNFTDNRFWFSGDVFIRWNILDFLSFHAAYNGGQIRVKVNEQNIRSNPAYFGPWDPANNYGVGSGFYPNPDGTPSEIRRTEFNLIRHGGFQGLLSVNFWPVQKFVPYIMAGVEFLNFEPRNSEEQNVALPNNLRGVYSKNVVGPLAGIGFEAYLTDDLVLNGKGLIHFPGTDYLDDYAAPGETKSDMFGTFGLGLSYYIFGYLDSDEDGLTDGDEVAVYKTDPHNPDTDGDGLRDGDEVKKYRTEPLKADTDTDGLSDGEEVTQYATDPLNADSDADKLTDGAELKAHKTNPKLADTDTDGLNDGEEVNTHKTSPTNKDSDTDGLADGDEVSKFNTSPTKLDSDGDGLNDGEELNTYLTNATKPDTDGDGLNDGEEVKQYKTNATKVDSDDDRLNDGDEVKTHHTDPTKADTDGDELADGEEVLRTRTDPLKMDTDADGINDNKDRCPLIKGVAPDGCPPKPPVNTVANFPGVLFIVNTDNFDLTVPGTLDNLFKIKALVEQCPDLKVEIEGHASGEGEAKRNQELSDLRAARVKSWLIEQGVSASKVARTVGYGSSKPVVPEPQPGKTVKKGKKTVTTKGATAEQVEAARKQNRRIAVRVVETCK